MDLSPVLSRPPLVEDAMEDVLVDDVRSGHCDVGSRSGRSRRDEASGVRVVISGEQALLLLRNDLHDEVRLRMIRTRLQRIGRCQESAKLRIEADAQVEVSIWFKLEAVHGAAHCAAAIEHLKPLRDVDPGQRWTELALARLEVELHKGDLNPVVSGHRQRPQDHDEPEYHERITSPDGRSAPP